MDDSSWRKIEKEKKTSIDPLKNLSWLADMIKKIKKSYQNDIVLIFFIKKIEIDHVLGFTTKVFRMIVCDNQNYFHNKLCWCFCKVLDIWFALRSDSDQLFFNLRKKI